MKFRCCLCGNNSAEVVADKSKIRFGVDREVLRCLRCDLVQLFPREEPSYDGYSKKNDFKGQRPKVKISKYLTKYLNVGEKNIEVGCGYGHNQHWLTQKGYSILGMDKDPSVLEGPNAIKPYFRFRIITKDWKDYTPPAKVDCIYAIHFFEHLAHPKQFLWWVQASLKKDGKFIFEVPCVEDPLIKLYKNKAYDRFCWYPYHMFFYSKRTLENMLCGLNFKIVRRQEYGIVNHLRWMILGKPGNWNPHIPIFDDVYKFLLKFFGYSDSLVVVGKNV